MYHITVYRLDNGRRIDLAHYLRADSAPEMEDAVTRLHKEFPAPGFTVVVDQ